MWWVTGSKGLLGREICSLLRAANVEHYATDRDVDITNQADIKNFLHGRPLSGIINCAAFTNVEACEEVPIEVINVNMVGPYNLALLSAQADVPLIHFSTDYVFNGNIKKNQGYKEMDPPRPLNKYGLSKYYGDNHIITNCKRYYIIRISWLYGKYGTNFVDKVIDKIQISEPLHIVDDQIGSLTSAYDVARLVLVLLATDPQKYGVYHYSGWGASSWFDVAQFISKSLYGMGIIPNVPPIEAIATSSANLRAKRPACSYLSKQKIESELGVAVIDWRDSLMSYIMNKFDELYRQNF